MTPTDHPLRRWRIERKLSQTEFGEKVGLTASHVSQLEARKKGVSIAVAVRIEQATGGEITTSMLVGEARQCA